MSASTVPLNEGIKNVKAIPISFCSEEARFIQPDSRVVHIPKNVWKEFIKIKTFHRMTEIPLYVGIRRSGDKGGKAFFFGHVEYTTNTDNSDENMALLPDWLFEYLGTDIMDTFVDIVYVVKPQDVDKIILKGNKSSYVNTDIKAELEEKLGRWNCINKGETFAVDDVTFTVVDIRAKPNDIFIDGKSINFGSIYSLTEVKLEFVEPDDIRDVREREEKRIEREKELKAKPLQKARDSSESKNNMNFGAHVSGFGSTGDVEKKNISNKNEEKKDYVPFQGGGLKIGTAPTKPLSKNEILEARLKRMAELEKLQSK